MWDFEDLSSLGLTKLCQDAKEVVWGDKNICFSDLRVWLLGVWFVFAAVHVLSGNTHSWGQLYEIGVQREALLRLWHLASQEVWKWSQVNCLAWLYEPKHKPRHWNWLYTHEKKIHKMIHKVLVTSRSWCQNMLLGLVLPWLNTTTEHWAQPRPCLSFHQINSSAQVKAPLFACFKI